MSSERFLLDARSRAEDILLGSLGFDSEATVLSVRKEELGYSGLAQWADGEQFEFRSDSPLSDLESWAIEIIEQSAALKLRACA